MRGGGKLSKTELVQALNTNIINGPVSVMSSDAEKEGAVETLADAFKEDPYLVWLADFQQGTYLSAQLIRNHMMLSKMCSEQCLHQ